MRTSSRGRTVVTRSAQQALDSSPRCLSNEQPSRRTEVRSESMPRISSDVTFPQFRRTDGFSYLASPAIIPITTPCIYANVAWSNGNVVGVRIGSTGRSVGARRRFQQHAREAQKLSGTPHVLRPRSPYFAAIHRLPVDAWRFVILNADLALRDDLRLLHLEHLYMDALRDQTNYGDYNATDPCKLVACRSGAHQYGRKYLRVQSITNLQ